MKPSLAPLAVFALAFSTLAHSSAPAPFGAPSILSPQQLRTNAKGDILERIQSGKEPHNWQNLDLEENGIVGVGANKTYRLFGQPQKEIVVAVIDSGVDVNHEDLQGKIWINEDEIPGNGIDDDGNGYVDDVFGWNFLGNRKGMATIVAADNANGLKLIKGNPAYQVDSDTLEITREVVRLRKLRERLAAEDRYLSIEDNLKLDKIASEVEYAHFKAKQAYDSSLERQKTYERAEKTLLAAGLEEVSVRALQNFRAGDPTVESAQREMLELLYRGQDKLTIEQDIAYYGSQANYHYNVASDTRAEIVQDNYDDQNERYYGNNDVIGPDSGHGTHVAGIIAAARDNGIGTQGIAPNARIMAIRAIPNGDERDKDVANAIRYAVDNGAHVINMSFGKSFSPYKSVVDEAIKYAEAHGVLLIQAAGNSGENIDEESFFPSKILGDQTALNWITVGASTSKKGPSLAAGFSNFGKKMVDVFAPGQNIHAPYPDNRYQTMSGTSMAAPVVAGVAAALMGYHPEADAQTIKDAILDNGTRFPNLKVWKWGIGNALFEKLSVTGSTVNLYNSLEALNFQTRPLALRNLAAR